MGGAVAGVLVAIIIVIIGLLILRRYKGIPGRFAQNWRNVHACGFCYVKSGNRS